MNDLEQRLANALRGEDQTAQDPSVNENYAKITEREPEPSVVRYDGDMSEAVEQDWGRPIAPDGLSYGNGYNISVETLTSGYILRVGCQSIAVESGEDVGKLIGLHLSDKTAGDKWMSSEKIVQKFLQESLQVK